MSISYSGIVGYGKSTLPSVDSWSSNMNILRDPPRSIMTRKIDKALDSNEILTTIDNSGDRVCEGINVYARGVNPMVGVDYSNNGSNGGQRQTGRSGAKGQQSFLPYRVMRDGAFRPPIKDQRDLYPLSRLPRIWTSSFTQPGFSDFSKKAMCPGSEKGTKTNNQMLRACVRPTATYKIEVPVIESFQPRYVIKNPLNVSATSGKHTKARFNGELGVPSAQIVSEPVRVETNVNKGISATRKNGDMTFDTNKYTQNVLTGDVNTNLSQNIYITPIDQVMSTEYTKDTTTITYDTPMTSYSKNDYIHKDISLSRITPIHDAYTNVGQNIYKRMEGQVEERSYNLNRPTVNIDTNIHGTRPVDNDINNRNYNLRPTISQGGFHSIPNKPLQSQDNFIPNIDTEKVRMKSRIYDMQQERNMDLGNIPYQVHENPN